ncbi:50S ribosomal protein L10 [Subdoligranulum sp. DSM 109015]|uniref:Large ribosomal subunit protein uL10 n=1 Tax=Gemmiger gallinarum TaxID=2779354 RepID=A0ABR9QZA5_9FIRM|nr:50S ribosomal protein L10 [Gemmiger gallinarum]MBE5036217.1 50S ribosomal protein L10 [Gemmiger gallinarum]
MPSKKILAAKQAYVKELNEKLSSAMAGVVVSYNGISVADDTKLRKELREAGVEYTVVKNTMLRLAVKGTQYEALTECFKGDTAIAISPEDPAAAARILCKFADADKSKRFTVKGGFCDGQVMDAAGVRSLSTMPNREGLLSMLAGSLSGIIGGLAVALQAVADKQEETPAA